MNRILKRLLYLFVAVTVFSCTSEDVEPNNDTNDPLGAWDSLSSHTLTYSHAIGSPVANPLGIATDQENIWLICGAQHDSTQQLLYYNPETYSTIKQITLDGLLEQQGDWVGGLTYFNGYLWVTVSGQTNKVVKIDTAHGDIIQTWSGPQTGGPADLAYSDEREIFFMSTGYNQIYTIHTVSGGSDYFFKIPTDSRNRGTAIKGDEIWVGDLFFNYVYIFDIHTGDYLGCIPDALQKKGNMCFYKDQLAVVDESGVRFYDVTP
ncbi:MAG: streptogramin lyase [Crocinitomix sp.]|jgi:streptogramin lyase